ncbi:MAG: hypothetical protein U1D30_10890 [Planctomycetota bacterium]
MRHWVIWGLMTGGWWVIAAQANEPATPPPVDRSNAPLSVDDIPLPRSGRACAPSITSVGPAAGNANGGGAGSGFRSGIGRRGRAGVITSVQGVEGEGLLSQEFIPPVDVMASPLPNPNDGLDGNRQIALSPFPNLNIQSGPLAQHQLPWYHSLPEEAPYSILRAMEFDSLFGAMKSNGVDNSQGGWYNGLQFGFPFWTEQGVGLQIGGVFEPNMLTTNYARFTGGFFHRAIWPPDTGVVPGLFQRISWGTVYDFLYDSDHRSNMGQMRNQLAFAMAPQRETGFWFTVPMQSDSTLIGPNAPLDIYASTTFAFYYRHCFPSEVDVTGFFGWAEAPGGMYVGTYMAYHFAQQASIVSWSMMNFESAGANAIYLGLRFHFAPHEDYTLISGNPQNRYRPFMHLQDAIQFQMRKIPIN